MRRRSAQNDTMPHLSCWTPWSICSGPGGWLRRGFHLKDYLSQER